MFDIFRKKHTAASVAREIVTGVGQGTVALIDKPEPLVPEAIYPANPELSKAELDEYAAVAARVGITGGALLVDRFQLFCKEENIPSYDRSQVLSFLNAKLGKGSWVWKGLREKDVERRAGWAWHQDREIVPFSGRKYTSAIPLPVLLTVDKISSAFPDEAFFYVSDKEDSLDDPFLLVSVETSGFIVERWDEPDFRER